MSCVANEVIQHIQMINIVAQDCQDFFSQTQKKLSEYFLKNRID